MITADGMHGRLALAYQEVLTVSARLRAGRQAPMDAAAFRAHVKSLLVSADGEARAAGYNPDAVKLAMYATIALVDETVYTSSQALQAEWTRQPLQTEIFGGNVAGEYFFRYVAELLARPDTSELADLLEVFQLCLLLGYRGKYSVAEPTALQGLNLSITQKIERIRGGSSDAMPELWKLRADEVVATAADPWVRRLLLIIAGLLVITIGLFAFYRVSLNGQINDVNDAALRITRDAARGGQ